MSAPDEAVRDARAMTTGYPLDEHGIPYEVGEDGGRIALVWKHGYRCLHADLIPSRDELKAAGYTRFRRIGFMDSAGRCPRCAAKRGQ